MTVMTRSDALNQLRILASVESEPFITEEELETALDQGALVDSAGLAPGATGYVETWEINRAAYWAWLIKMGKAAELVNFNVNGVGGFSRGALFTNCGHMANHFKGKLLGTIRVTSESSNV